MKAIQSSPWVTLAVVMLAFLPIVLDLTILHVAIPALTLGLGASGTEVLWIIDIYPLLMASLLIPMGTLADRVGHARMMLIGLAVFASGSAAAAFAPSAGLLIAARALMAVGSAMVMPCTLALIRLAFSDERQRAIALGLWGAVGSAGAAVGPLIGGILLEHFWWGAVFLINLPVMLVVWPLVAWLAPRNTASEGGDWTVGQAASLIAGMMGTVYGLKSLLGSGYSLGGALSLAAGLGILACFVQYQRRSKNPMLDVSLFSHPAISTGVLMAVVVMGALAGVELMLAQQLQFGRGMSPLDAALFMLPLMVSSAVGGPLAGWILGMAGLRTTAAASMALAATAFAMLAWMGSAAEGIGAISSLALLGLALSIGLTASSVAIMSSTPADKAGAGGALEATSYDLGTGLGITAFGLLLAADYRRHVDVPADLSIAIGEHASRSIGETFTAAKGLDPRDAEVLMDAGRTAFASAYGSVLITAAVVVAVMAVAVFWLLRNSPTSDDN
ncbi:MFS transporter [Isoptericola jiangsuensis]|uniref:MFS transporter n=1 Tax=Isoptericola jiangsuensis TaxID=548579 RepID=UPI0038667BF5